MKIGRFTLLSMDAYEAIMTRRSVAKTSDKVCDQGVITRLLDAGVRAPNHFLTQPWRFVVLTGDARNDLGEAWAAGARRQGKGGLVSAVRT